MIRNTPPLSSPAPLPLTRSNLRALQRQLGARPTVSRTVSVRSLSTEAEFVALVSFTPTPQELSTLATATIRARALKVCRD